MTVVLRFRRTVAACLASAQPSLYSPSLPVSATFFDFLASCISVVAVSSSSKVDLSFTFTVLAFVWTYLASDLHEVSSSNEKLMRFSLHEV